MADEEEKKEDAPEEKTEKVESKAGMSNDYKKGYKAGMHDGKKKYGTKAEDDDDDEDEGIPGAKKPDAKDESMSTPGVGKFTTSDDAGQAGRMGLKSEDRIEALEKQLKSLEEKSVFKSVEKPAPVDEKVEELKSVLDTI